MTVYIAEARQTDRNICIGYFEGDVELIKEFVTLNYNVGYGLEIRQIKIRKIDKEKFAKQKELLEQKKIVEKQLEQLNSQLGLYRA